VGSLTFDRNKSLTGVGIKVPCGQCIGCRLERSRQWAVRCMHEASLYDDNCFLTLTYDDEHLPPGGSLVKKHASDFIKRLRERVRSASGGRFRVYYCGEYGEKLARPHYHLLLFGFDFADKYFWRNSGSGFRLYRSEFLESVWTFGSSEIGAVSFESAAYVARYVMKKRLGRDAKEYYTRVDEFGQVWELVPEFTDMSRRPGIGKPWLDRFSKEVYDHDSVISNFREARPPRFYDLQLEKEDASRLETIKRSRRRRALQFKDNNTDERLSVRERVLESRVHRLKREI